MDEATSKAERIRASRDFNIEHLPHRYRDNLLVDYARATSDLTCRLTVPCISGERPDTWPDSDHAFPFAAFKGENSTTVGTGWVSRVNKYTEEEWDSNCPCEECRQPSPHTPKKTWGEVYINTACHVVYDDEEAKNTTCLFFYDSHETDINEVPSLTGFHIFCSDVKGDWATMRCFTHDMELLDELDKMCRRCYGLCDKVYNKYVSNKYPGVGWDTDVEHDLCIVVSHPHGCTKEISVGTRTHREVVGKHGYSENITYSYNTPTCPGSSGAAVITLCKDNRRTGWFCHLPPHSQGRQGNDNNSGSGWEIVELTSDLMCVNVGTPN